MFNRNSFILLLLLLQFCSFKLASAQISDSLKTVDSLNITSQKDSSFLNVIHSSGVKIEHPENYQQNLTNAFFPFYDVLISKFNAVPDSLPIAGTFRSGFYNYRNYLSLNTNNLKPDTGRSTSRLCVILGSKREQLLFVDHIQKFGKYWDGNLSYNSLISEGFLLHSFTKVKAFSTGVHFGKGFYDGKVQFNSHKIQADENAGIIPGQETAGISKSDYTLLKINLSGGQWNTKLLSGNIAQSFCIFNPDKNDTIPQTKQGLFFDLINSYTQTGYSYTDAADTVFYANIFKDSISTFDTTSVKDFHNTINLKYISDNLMPDFKTTISAGISRYDIQYKMDSLTNDFSYHVPHASLNLINDVFEINSSYSKVISDNQQKNNYTFTATGQMNLESTIFNSVAVNYFNGRNSPSMIASQYISNHFLWNNKSLEDESLNKIGAEVEVWNHRFTGFASLKKYINKIYFDENALPQQSKEDISVFTGGFKLELQFKKINFYNEIIFQNSDNQIIRVPATLLFSRMSFQDYFFNKALKAEFGFSGIYSTTYKADAYMPATGQYYLQNSQTVAGAVCLNVFANLQIGTAIVMLKIENLNHGIFGDENFIAPDYPVPPRTFKLGVTWVFKN